MEQSRDEHPQLLQVKCICAARLQARGPECARIRPGRGCAAGMSGEPSEPRGPQRGEDGHQDHQLDGRRVGGGLLDGGSHGRRRRGSVHHLMVQGASCLAKASSPVGREQRLPSATSSFNQTPPPAAPSKNRKQERSSSVRTCIEIDCPRPLRNKRPQAAPTRR